MSAIAAAIIGSTVVTAGVGIYSANKAAESAEEGLEAATETSEANLALQTELADTQREDFAPWRETGAAALEQLYQGVQSGDFDSAEFNFDPSSIDPTTNAGYQFRLDQGRKARENSASRRGRLQSGAQDKALEEYSQNFASNEYDKAYAREYGRASDEYIRDTNEKNKNFNILSGLSQSGQASAAGQAGATSQLASTSSNILSNLGYSQQQTANQVGDAYVSGANQVGGAVNQGIQNWMTYDYLNQPTTPTPGP